MLPLRHRLGYGLLRAHFGFTSQPRWLQALTAPFLELHLRHLPPPTSIDVLEQHVRPVLLPREQWQDLEWAQNARLVAWLRLQWLRLQPRTEAILPTATAELKEYPKVVPQVPTKMLPRSHLPGTHTLCTTLENRRIRRSVTTAL